MAGSAVGVQVCQVGRQNEFRLDDGQQQTNSDDGSELGVYLPKLAAEIRQGIKGHYGGKHAEECRYRHAQGASDGVAKGVAFLFAHGVNAFAHNHGIIHHNSQRHDETKGGELVQ